MLSCLVCSSALSHASGKNNESDLNQTIAIGTIYHRPIYNMMLYMPTVRDSERIGRVLFLPITNQVFILPSNMS